MTPSSAGAASASTRARPSTTRLVERLLRAGMAAPSAGNQQPWQFIVIRDRTTLTRIAEWHPYAKMLPSAPVAVLVLGDPGAARWAALWPQDCAACVENMLIEAESLGLGAVWLGVHPLPERETALRGLLGIPEHVVPFAIVPVRLAAGAQASRRTATTRRASTSSAGEGGGPRRSAARVSARQRRDASFSPPFARVLLAFDP